MKREIKNRVLEEANLLKEENLTIRELAKRVRKSKSTVHKDLQERLKGISPQLYEQVQIIFQKHIEQRHILGGESTRKKYCEKNS